MPTAKSAATKPAEHTYVQVSSKLRRIALTAVGVIAGLAMLLPAQTIVAAAGLRRCQPGNARAGTAPRPPDYIRVLRRQSGHVDRVPFKKYVLTVMGKEWPGYLPQQVIKAGAVAVKQYAWYPRPGQRPHVAHMASASMSPTASAISSTSRTSARVRQDHYAARQRDLGCPPPEERLAVHDRLSDGQQGRVRPRRDRLEALRPERHALRLSGDGYQQILRIYYGPVSLSGSGNGQRCRTND